MVASLVRELDRRQRAPADARESVRDLFRGLADRDRDHVDSLAADVELVVSELVTNAVTHASSAVAVVVNKSGGGVRIEVRDQGPGTPDPQPPSDSAEGGRGLMVVSALAKAWGIDSAPPTKSVWVELATG
jgi:anti-sigma regulatory factor (Ser/Thr protein kinase)